VKQATGKELKLPESLADYVELAKFMNANGGVTGSAMQGQRGDPNSMEFSNYLFSSGAAYLDKDGKVALNSPEAVKALELYVDNIQHGAQKGALSATLDDTFRLQCRLSVETRTNAFQIRTGQFPEAPISVYFTLRQYWGRQPYKTFGESYTHQRKLCQELVEAHIVEGVIRPLAQAIAAKQ
jgi:hypothetical protein